MNIMSFRHVTVTFLQGFVTILKRMIQKMVMSATGFCTAIHCSFKSVWLTFSHFVYINE